MRRATSADSESTRPLKFSIGSDSESDENTSRSRVSGKPSQPVFRHVRDTHPPPTYAHVRIVRFLLRVFPRVLIALCALVLLVALLPGGWRVALCAASLLPPPPMRAGENLTLIAHRGCEFPYPENSLHALRFGAQHVGFVELDIVLSSDEKVVVMHDDTLDRTTNGSGITCTKPLSYIEQLRLNMPERDPRGKIAQARFCMIQSPSKQSIPCVYRVPTLEEILDDLPDGTRFLLDVKECYADGITVTSPICSNCTILMERTRDLMEKYAVKPENVVFSSTQAASLAVFRKGMPEGSKYALSVDASYSHLKRSTFMDRFTSGNWDSAAFYVGLAAVRPDFVRLVRESDVTGTTQQRQVYAWTIRRDLEYRMARCAGVNNLIVAEPDKVKTQASWDVESLLGEER